jgi:site-specific recombinase XerD
MDRLFREYSKKSKGRVKDLAGIPNWPYMDSLCLHDVTTENVQQLISTVLERGYSIQTATHIRNVIRTVFLHAKQTRSFDGENPAESVKLPDMARKEAHALTLDQLKCVIQSMQHPEREIALIAILTKMSIAEICGLQWKYVNLSGAKRVVDRDWLAPRTIAIRNQSCRGEFALVTPSRRRSIPLPELLLSVLSDLTACGASLDSRVREGVALTVMNR